MTRLTLLLILIPLFLGVGNGLAAQNGTDAPKEVRAEHGWHLSPQGRLHVLVIFAEINFDSIWGNLDPTPQGGNKRWKAGELPVWKDEMFDPRPGLPNSKGYMTKYFDQASFGTFQVTGDYIKDVITINISDVRDRNNKVKVREAYGNGLYRQTVINKVNAMGSLQTASGGSEWDFDRWTYTSTGVKNESKPNKKYDMVMLIWRNIHVRNLGNNSGFAQRGSIGNLFGRGSDASAVFRVSDNFPEVIMRHEFSHLLYGGNNFHTASGGAGARTFMASAGGWSNMSNGDCCSRVWNGWDRERMQWKNPENDYLLNAVCASTGKDVNGELAYGEPICNGNVVMLRDFVTSGDVLKIKLPHIPEGKKNQYLWLENHQIRKGKIDHHRLRKGLYGFIQAGKDQRKGKGVFGGTNGYTWPLVAAGNYDFDYNTQAERFELDTDKQNPLTGYNYIMRHPYDLNGDGKILLATDMGTRTEYIWGKEVECDGNALGEDYFCYKTCPIFGIHEMGFSPYDHNKIGLSYNPPATNLYTFKSPGGASSADVRRIYLNGISVELLREDEQGNIYLKIRWDDFDLVQDLRWCGNLLLSEKINITAGKTLTLDQGYSPQVPIAPQVIDGKNVFAKPTVLEVAKGAEISLERNAKMVVKRGSTLLIRSGSKVRFEKKSSIEVEPGGYIFLEKGAEVRMNGKDAGFRLNRDIKLGVNPMLLDDLAALGPGASIPTI